MNYVRFMPVILCRLFFIMLKPLVIYSKISKSSPQHFSALIHKNIKVNFDMFLKELLIMRLNLLIFRIYYFIYVQKC